MTDSEIADSVYEAVLKAGLIIAFTGIDKKKLVSYHNTLGQDIRNQYKMWEDKWTPIIKDGVDISPYHPDARSMLILKAVWEMFDAWREFDD